MSLNQANVQKWKRQQSDRIHVARMKAMQTERTNPLYDVYEGHKVVAYHQTLQQCAAYGKGYTCKPVPMSMRLK